MLRSTAFLKNIMKALWAPFRVRVAMPSHMALMENLFSAHGGFQTAMSLAVLCLGFALFYLIPAFALGARLRNFGADLRRLASDPALAAEPTFSDGKLQEDWQRYRRTLRSTAGSGSPLTTDVSADVCLSREMVIENRLHARLFKYIPMVLVAFGAVHFVFSLADAKSADVPLSQLLATVRPSALLATAAVCIALLMWLVHAQTLSWLSATLRSIWLELDLAFLRTEVSPTPEYGIGLSGKVDLLQKRVDEIREPLQQLAYQHTQAVELLQSINRLQVDNRENDAAERDSLARRLAEIICVLGDDAKAISEFHLTTAHQLGDQSRAALQSLADDIKAHATNITSLGRSEITRLSADAQRCIDSLRAAASDNQNAVATSATSLRSSTGDLAASVELVNSGAANLKEVAKEFLRAGMDLSGVFDKSSGFVEELRAATDAAAKASKDIEEMTGSYTQSRVVFMSIAKELQSYLEGAKHERDSSGQAAKKLEEVSRKLVEIQERSFKGMERHHARVAETLTAIQRPAVELSAGLRAVNSSANRIAIIAGDLVKLSSTNNVSERSAKETELAAALDAFCRSPTRLRTA